MLHEQQVAQVLDQVAHEPAEIVPLLGELFDERERTRRVTVDDEIAETEEGFLLDRAEELGGILDGDTNANATVNAADVSQTKSRIGQTVDATNFRSDVNANGSINAADTAIVKQNSGTSLPP